MLLKACNVLGTGYSKILNENVYYRIPSFRGLFQSIQSFVQFIRVFTPSFVLQVFLLFRKDISFESSV